MSLVHDAMQQASKPNASVGREASNHEVLSGAGERVPFVAVETGGTGPARADPCPDRPPVILHYP